MAEKPYTLKGKVVELSDPQEVTEKFTKITLVVEMPGDYPQEIPVDFGNKAMEAVQDARVGDEAVVDFYLGGFKGKTGYRGASLKGVGYKASDVPF